MAVYAVMTAKPEPLVEAKLATQYLGKYHAYSNQAWLLSTADSATEISRKLGGKQKMPDGTLTGQLDGYILITDLGPSYWGFANTATWNWLKEAHEGRI